MRPSVQLYHVIVALLVKKTNKWSLCVCAAAESDNDRIYNWKIAEKMALHKEHFICPSSVSVLSLADKQHSSRADEDRKNAV